MPIEQIGRMEGEQNPEEQEALAHESIERALVNGFSLLTDLKMHPGIANEGLPPSMAIYRVESKRGNYTERPRPFNPKELIRHDLVDSATISLDARVSKEVFKRLSGKLHSPMYKRSNEFDQVSMNVPLSNPEISQKITRELAQRESIGQNRADYYKHMYQGEGEWKARIVYHPPSGRLMLDFYRRAHEKPDGKGIGRGIQYFIQKVEL